jgi:hypothetical protein
LSHPHATDLGIGAARPFNLMRATPGWPRITLLE